MVLKKPKFGVKISPADVKLFSYLYENKVAFGEQIRRDIYPNYSKRSVQNRLSKLTKNHFLKGSFHDGIGNKLIFGLSEYSFNRFIKPLGENVKQELGSHAISHDIDLVNIRQALSQSGRVKNYYTENLITGDGLVSFSTENLFVDDVRPDAVIEVELKGKLFCLTLEYESARKYVDRYKTLFRTYYNNKSISGVLYICKNDHLLHYIQNIEKSVIGDETPKFYYSDFSKWRVNETKVFTNLRDSCISL